MPPILRRRKKKSEEDGVVGTEEREKRYQMGESVARETRLWGFSSLWFLLLEMGGKCGGLSIH